MIAIKYFKMKMWTLFLDIMVQHTSRTGGQFKRGIYGCCEAKVAVGLICPRRCHTAVACSPPVESARRACVSGMPAGRVLQVGQCFRSHHLLTLDPLRGRYQTVLHFTDGDMEVERT